MSGSQQLLLGGAPTVTPVDPYFYSVTSLLHGDGTNGGQNNTFLDSSSNNFTITRNGNTTQGSFSPFSQTGWSNYFDGTGDYLTAASNAAFALPGDFSIECWAYFTGATAVGGGASGELLFASNATGGAVICVRSGTTFTLSATSVADDLSASVTFTPNQWYHLVAARTGTTAVLYVNGTRVATGTVSRSYAQGGFSTQSGFNGYLASVRIVKGSNPYGTGTTITVPTAPLTAISGTSILTCQANRFLDASSNNFTITRNGDASVQPFSPFNPTTAYSTGSIGGSGYFDGSGDYISAPSNAAFDLGSGNFTMEAWIYPMSYGAAYGIIFARYTSGGASNQPFFLSLETNGTVRAGINGTYTLQTTATAPLNAWTHVAWTRSGNDFTIWLNGVSSATLNQSVTLNNPSIQVDVGAFGLLSSNYLTGYIANARIVKGTAVYTAAFTPPTAPLTAITNTSLLLNYTNGAIFDNAAVADYETVGNAQISTSVKKYGTGSLAFDGTGDYLVTYAPSTDMFAFGTGDFTVEFWYYSNNSGVQQILYDSRPSGTNGAYITFYKTSGNVLELYVNTGVRLTGTTTLSSGVWYHVALCRVASQTKIFVNGIQSGPTYADTTTYLNGANRPVIGSDSATVGNLPINGYIDDLRISKGVGRYPYNFTPPTAALPDIGGTITLTADPYYEYTTLLLPGNGTNGAQNNTFLDSSTNAFTITRNGNTTQGTFSPFSQTGWGNYFDGTGDYLTTPSNTAFAFGTGDFTVEAFVYITATNSQTLRVFTTSGATSNFAFEINSSLQLGHWNGAASFTLGGSVPLNQWTHVAWVRSGTTVTGYINGTSIGTATSSANMVNNLTISIGATADYTAGQTAYISNLRVVKGTAVYTANFTPSTTPLTAVSGTSLLTCQSNRFIDNSTNAFAITRNGDVSVQAFSPFNPTASWSAATYGGSGYFDGSGDYLTLPTAAESDLNLTGTFTFECWFYCSTSGDMWFFSKGGGTNDWNSTNGIAYQFMIESGSVKAQFNTGGSFLTISATAPASASWNHFAIGRNGTTLRAWLNGASMGTSTTSISPPTTRNIIKVGANTVNGSTMNGYLAGMIAVNGTDVYGVGNTTITVPTAPPTAITNTKFLANFTNAGIYDATSKNDLETVGNAQISTTQSKFGGSSMYFDGTGDGLIGLSTQLASFGTGDFTVESWVYLTTISGADRYLFTTGNAVDTSLRVYLDSTGKVAVRTSFTLVLTSTNPLVVNTWTHVAVCRYNGTLAVYLNGVQNGTASYSTAINCNGNISVGSDNNGGSSMIGYLNDFRVTKGIARYTSNFTPPTTAFLTL